MKKIHHIIAARPNPMTIAPVYDALAGDKAFVVRLIHTGQHYDAPLTAAKMDVPVAHLEAGLRSFDTTMAEKINRMLTARVVSILWTPSPDADENLLHEGPPAERIRLVGNFMTAPPMTMLPAIRQCEAWKALDLAPGNYAVPPQHRPGNVNNQDPIPLWDGDAGKWIDDDQRERLQ